MKRFLIFCLVVAFIAAIPVSHSLMAKKMPKVKICHITGETATHYTGHIIIISGNAVQAHYNHGDHDPTCDDRVAGDPCSRAKGPEPRQTCPDDPLCCEVE